MGKTSGNFEMHEKVFLHVLYNSQDVKSQTRVKNGNYIFVFHQNIHIRNAKHVQYCKPYLAMQCLRVGESLLGRLTILLCNGKHFS